MSEKIPTIPDTWKVIQHGFGPSAERNALCARLGIPWDTVGDMQIWIQVGIALAAQQPEFCGRRGRGRPQRDKGGIDYERAKQIKAMRRALPSGESATDRALIKRAIQNRDRKIRRITRHPCCIRY